MSSQQSVEKLLKILQSYFAHPSHPGAPLVKKINAVYQIVLTDSNSKYVIDLKNGTGSVNEGDEPKADCTFTMKAEDFASLAAGKLNPQTAFMSGKLKIKGSVGVAMKFTPDVFPKIDPKLIADPSNSVQDIVKSLVGSSKL